ncbi:MAG TPA: hypothetical protein DCR87_02640 [Acidobacteria bacterium]|nr:hypothetical protein [Acidobacteriota bacterium]
MISSLKELARCQLRSGQQASGQLWAGCWMRLLVLNKPKEYYFNSGFDSGIILLPRDSFKESKK